MKIKLTHEYLGTAFSGWQYQPNVPTIQGELERALLIYLKGEAKKRFQEEPRLIRINTSGRTDSGVHALAQVGSFKWPEEFPYEKDKFFLALNAITPPEIVIHKIEELDDSFDARSSPHVKCYEYTILTRPGAEGAYRYRAWSMREKVQVAPMVEAAKYFYGQHDFSAFRAADCAALTSVRTLLHSELTQKEPGVLAFTTVGKGYLKYMVRNLVGTLVAVGRGNMKPEEVKKLLQSGTNNSTRSDAGMTAPSYGLTLKWVRYIEEDIWRSWPGIDEPEEE
jgi:tRNA pseudouridine38-40 synthase